MHAVEVSLGGTPVFVQPSRVEAVGQSGERLFILMASGETVLVAHQVDADMGECIRTVARQIWGDPKDPYRTEGDPYQLELLKAQLLGEWVHPSAEVDHDDE